MSLQRPEDTSLGCAQLWSIACRKVVSATVVEVAPARLKCILRFLSVWGWGRMGPGMIGNVEGIEHTTT